MEACFPAPDSITKLRPFFFIHLWIVSGVIATLD